MATFMSLVLFALIGLVVVFAINRVVGAGKAAGRAAGRAVTHSPEALRLAALNREATAAKRAGDWARACTLLAQAKAIEGDAYAQTRLAKFLQQAGRLDEALAEIQWLIDRSHLRARTQPNNDGAVMMQYMRLVELIGIYDDAILICKRAKRSDLQVGYESRRADYEKRRAKLGVLTGEDWTR